MAKKSSIYWVDIKWNRYDAGDKLWYLKAIVSYALKRDDLKWEFTEFLKWLKL
jgi:UTP--glucose-1-phosphate uridylyltransferase